MCDASRKKTWSVCKHLLKKNNTQNAQWTDTESSDRESKAYKFHGETQWQKCTVSIRLNLSYVSKMSTHNIWLNQFWMLWPTISKILQRLLNSNYTNTVRVKGTRHFGFSCRVHTAHTSSTLYLEYTQARARTHSHHHQQQHHH